MSKIKYLGSSDVHTLEKGENFAGRLAEPLSKAVVFDASQGHLVDTEEAGLSEAAVELLLTDKDNFRDVTDLDKIPTSLNEQTFRGLPKSTSAPAQAEEPDSKNKSGDDGGDKVTSGGQAATSAGGGTPAPVGGSTRGRSSGGSSA